MGGVILLLIWLLHSNYSLRKEKAVNKEEHFFIAHEIFKYFSFVTICEVVMLDMIYLEVKLIKYVSVLEWVTKIIRSFSIFPWSQTLRSLWGIHTPLLCLVSSLHNFFLLLDTLTN